VKDNQPTLKEDIADYVADETLRCAMDSSETLEQNSGRIEWRRAFATSEVSWLEDRENWPGLACIGAINTQFTTKKGTSNQWHYYISSRSLTADELLRHARAEWSVETMHWLLDVHFGEDFCRVEDENIQQNLNILRKIVINCIKLFKQNTSGPFLKLYLTACLINTLF